MLESGASTAIALDIRTLFVVATCITLLLGVLLLFAWAQDRIHALAWLGAAYLIGGFSVAAWGMPSSFSPALPTGIANALLFLAFGMIWNAARLFHGRPSRWGATAGGATVWLAACMVPEFAQWPPARITLSSVIVSIYVFLTAAELWRERRKTLSRRWLAMFVPILLGAVFLFPIPLAGLLPSDHDAVSLASGWMALFVIETMLYVVGTAFIVLALAEERAVRVHKDAASTDELTGLLNRRGLLASAQRLINRRADSHEPVSVLMFDLDHFKSVNDRFGHLVGDEALRLFAATANANLRASDLIGRFGGEEFVAVLPSPLADAAAAAERVRTAFEAAAVSVAGCHVGATLSAGAASGAPGADIASLLMRADSGLYRAKANGRNRVEVAEEEMKTIFTTAPPGHQDEAVGHWCLPAPAPASKPALAA
ncbi:MAG: GGDEF domain-containing protein [Xanthobacteraceae bacterium]|jgi:diguanylate cyclase (GGDEF)-like protein